MNLLRPLAWCAILLACALVCLLLALPLGGFAQETEASCPPTTVEQLADRLQRSQEPKKLRLVFFSTWCSDCLTHLKSLGQLDSSSQRDVLAVAVFDSQKKVEKTLQSMGLKIPCAFDQGIGKKLGVKVVPFEKIIGIDDLR